MLGGGGVCMEVHPGRHTGLHNSCCVGGSGSGSLRRSLLELCPRGNNKDVIIIIIVHDNVYIPC
jgi:hypothetical protein